LSPSQEGLSQEPKLAISFWKIGKNGAKHRYAENNLKTGIKRIIGIGREVRRVLKNARPAVKFIGFRFAVEKRVRRMPALLP
jgi:hypothetical protein